jgi:hypothetical protein
MTIIATARIPERIDQSPTERLTRVLPELPPTVTGALHWANVDLKATAAMPPCPVWCSGVDHQHDTDGSIVHFSTARVVTVAGVTTQRTHEIQVDLCRIDDPGQGVGETVIGFDAEQCALSPQHSLQVAAMLTDLAALALGQPAGHSHDWWMGYAAGLVGAADVAEKVAHDAAHPVRTWLRRHTWPVRYPFIRLADALRTRGAK